MFLLHIGLCSRMRLRHAACRSLFGCCPSGGSRAGWRLERPPAQQFSGNTERLKTLLVTCSNRGVSISLGCSRRSGDPPVVLLNQCPAPTWEALRPFSLSTVHGERAGSPRGGFTTSARGDKRPSSLSRLDFWRDVGTTTLTKGETTHVHA